MSEFIDHNKKKEDYYSVARNAGEAVAEFSGEKFSVANKIHRFFHSQPVAAPAVVLITSIIVFGLIVGDR